jgi:two-component system response regulator FlrC
MAVPEREIALDAAPLPLLAADPVSRQVQQLAQRVARADVTVTLTGESGVGKEVYARYIHAHSRRCQGPLIAINCAAIPETMLEATLFGHEKGAFTGAALAHSGKFEQADGGTLLLDEITEMAQGLQAKLLRVLQEREVERLGAASGRRVDVRVIAMSNRDLRQAVADGVLREDIYYRLNVFPIRIPPLRERPGDILPLAERLIERHSAGLQDLPKLSSEAAARLREHRWPGNVRELDNVMQRALILQQGDSIEVEDLQIETAEPGSSLQAADTSPLLASSLRVSEGELILDALRAENGQRKAAALRLGISPRTLRYKLARLREHGLAIP